MATTSIPGHGFYSEIKTEIAAAEIPVSFLKYIISEITAAGSWMFFKNSAEIKLPKSGFLFSKIELTKPDEKAETPFIFFILLFHQVSSYFIRVGHPFFSKERTVLAFFPVLFKRTERSLSSFPFFIKERNDLCVHSRSL